jgi:hypothetical protein
MERSCACHHLRSSVTKKKTFFFEKKNQKTFVCLVPRKLTQFHTVIASRPLAAKQPRGSTRPPDHHCFSYPNQRQTVMPY